MTPCWLAFSRWMVACMRMAWMQHHVEIYRTWGRNIEVIMTLGWSPRSTPQGDMYESDAACRCSCTSSQPRSIAGDWAGPWAKLCVREMRQILTNVPVIEASCDRVISSDGCRRVLPDWFNDSVTHLKVPVALRALILVVATSCRLLT